MENLCSSFFSFTSLAGVEEGVIMVTLSCPCPSPRHVNISCDSPLFMSLTLRDSLTVGYIKIYMYQAIVYHVYHPTVIKKRNWRYSQNIQGLQGCLL